MTVQEAINRVVSGETLTIEQASTVMEQVMDGQATSAQIASLVTALRMRGETVEEIAGFARIMRERAARVEAPGILVDTCGTGGDGLHTFNISTTSAFVAAGAGVQVAKHGNRAASSQTGSADVLEQLGITVSLTPDQVAMCIHEAGIGFMFAQTFHPAMKHAAGPRKEIGIRTVFNLLGPLCNPAHPYGQVLGVPRPELTEVLAKVLGALGVEHALVVCSAEGMDEISNTGETRVSEYQDGTVTTYTICPEDFGMHRGHLTDLSGGNASENAEITLSILGGEESGRRDTVLLNAAAALFVGGVAKSLTEGVALARQSIRSGAALNKVEALRVTSRRLAG